MRYEAVTYNLTGEGPLESRGAWFGTAEDGVHGPTVGLKCGVELPRTLPGGAVKGGDGEPGGTQAEAWDDDLAVIHEDAAPAADPEIEELRVYWRANPEKWAALYESTRWALLQEMQLREL